MANKVTEPIKNEKKIETFLQLLKGSNERNWLIAKYQLNTGLRISDVVKVKVSDFMTETLSFKEYVVVTEKKTGKDKKIKLNNELKKALKGFVKDYKLSSYDYLFKSKKSPHITENAIYVQLKRVANDLKIENFGTHSLRKTWGYWSYKKSKYNIALIQDMFNHSDQKTTLRYIGITQETKDELYSVVQF